MQEKSARMPKLRPSEKFKFYLDHADESLEWLAAKLNLSIRSIKDYRTRAKKMRIAKKICTPELPPTNTIPTTEIPDSITEEYIEKEILHASSREDLDRIKLMIDFLYKKDKFAKTEEKAEKIDLGAFLHEHGSATTV